MTIESKLKDGLDNRGCCCHIDLLNNSSMYGGDEGKEGWREGRENLSPPLQ